MTFDRLVTQSTPNKNNPMVELEFNLELHQQYVSVLSCTNHTQHKSMLTQDVLYQSKFVLRVICTLIQDILYQSGFVLSVIVLSVIYTADEGPSVRNTLLMKFTVYVKFKLQHCTILVQLKRSYEPLLNYQSTLSNAYFGDFCAHNYNDHTTKNNYSTSCTCAQGKNLKLVTRTKSWLKIRVDITSFRPQ